MYIYIYIYVHISLPLSHPPHLRTLCAGLKRIVRLLIKANASVNTQDRKGNTALHYAVAYSYTPLAAYLVSHGADDSIPNVKGNTCLFGI